MLYMYALLCVFLFCFAFFAISHDIMPGSSEDERDRDIQTKGAAFELAMDHLGPCSKGYYCCIEIFFVRGQYENNFFAWC